MWRNKNFLWYKFMQPLLDSSGIRNIYHLLVQIRFQHSVLYCILLLFPYSALPSTGLDPKKAEAATLMSE